MEVIGECIEEMGKEEGERLNIDFGESPNVLKDKYMDVYEDIFCRSSYNQ